MEKILLKAEERKVFGKKLKSLRKEGILPANVFGKNIKSYAIQVSYLDFEKVYKKAGETGLIELSVGSKTAPILIHAIQLDPVSGKMLHVDLIQVDLKQKVTAEVPVELIGEAPAEKQGLGTLVMQMNEIEVEALPADLPEKFEVDVSILIEEDQSISVKDLKVDTKKVEIKDEAEAVVVKIEKAKEEKEEEVPVSTEVEEGTGEEEGGVEEKKEEEIEEKTEEEK